MAETSGKPPYQRRQYLVDRTFQLRFVSRMFLAVLVVAGLSCLGSSALLWRQLYVPGEGTQTPVLVAALLAVAATLLIELLLAIPIVFYLGIRQSHSIIGPMKRIAATLKAIGEGDFSRRLTLREGDVLTDLAEAINAMAEALGRRFPRQPGA